MRESVARCRADIKDAAVACYAGGTLPLYSRQAH